jgi:CRP/FNR family cyclic AMP-dependent transcriptional regulator
MLHLVTAVRGVTGFRDLGHRTVYNPKCGGVTMRAPYGLNILDNCLACPIREEHLFCNLPMAAVQRLNEIKSTALYPKSAMLFIEGQQPRGVFVLCTGKAKLSTCSSEGKTIITQISEGGDVLGLNATISNRPYEVTAEMIEAGQANFIARDALLQFLKDHGEVAVRVAEELSRNYYIAYEEIRTLGLTTSPGEKFAKLLLSWAAESGQGNGSQQLRMTFTHEEIAEMIGTTRETVSRLFSEFKKRQLLQVKGATLTIRNKPALEKLVHS